MTLYERLHVTVVLIFLSLSAIRTTGSTALNGNESWTNYGTISRSAEGPIEIHYANKSTEQVNGTRQDQIMILGKSEISIPADKKNWPGVKLVTGDSYLKALEYSQNIRNSQGGAVEINSKSTHVIRREFNPSPIFKPDEKRDNPQLHARVLYQGGNPAPNAMQPDQFAPPVQPPSNFNAQPFMPVQNDNIYDTYGPPMVQQPTYDPYAQPPVHDVYGVPAYPPENLMTNYYPQQAYAPQQTYGNPSGNPYSFDMLTSMGLNWPFLKLNALTVAKILLKLVIFKLIVKFIGLICLLLFIPKLDWKKGSSNETDSEDRSLNSYDYYYKNLDDITTRVWTAIEQFEKTMSSEQPERNESCTTIWCMVQNAFFSTSEAKAEEKAEAKAETKED